MNPHQLTWATPDHYTKHLVFETQLVPEGGTLHLQQNESLKKVSFNAGGGFLCIIMREVER